jgi:hypothetical protein
MKALRICLVALAWLCAFISAATYAVAVFLNDSNPVLGFIWKASGLSGFGAFALDQILGRFAAKQAAKEAAILRSELSEANQRAATAIQNAEAANKRAEAARMAADDASLALERYKAPRSLSNQSRAAIQNGLASLGPREIDIWICGSTTEIDEMAGTLTELFQGATWDIRNLRPFGVSASGILLQIRAGSDEATSATANAIVTLLRGNGIVAGRWNDFAADERGPVSLVNGSGRRTNAAIRLIVGAKPV